MNFNQHYDLTGKHAFLGASQHAWLNYSPQKIEQVYLNEQKREHGTVLHSFASQAIKNRIKLAPLKKALNLFVNDAIGFNLESEQVLYYSDNCFGTADGIQFKNGQLRIHDLKTGDTPVIKFGQLDIYSALFCLEYHMKPRDISFVERLYQGNGFTEYVPDQHDIKDIMGLIVNFDKVIERIKSQEE